MFIVDVPGFIVIDCWLNPGSPAAYQVPDTLTVDDPKFSARTAAVLQFAYE